VVLGAAGVGKSSIISRFLHDEYKPEYTPTVEDFHQTELLQNGWLLPLDIVDTTGYYAFPAMMELAIATGDAFVMVFNIGDNQSFQHISAMRDLIFQIKGDTVNTADIPIVVVGNKIDLDNRSLVNKTTMECIVTMDWDHSYVETSAKTNTNIRTVFDELLVRFKLSGDVSTPSFFKRCMKWSQKCKLQDGKKNEYSITWEKTIDKIQ
jgi:small GTP-binding protein